MNDGPGCGCGPRQPRLRRAAALAATACIAVLATACAGGSSPAASATGGPTREQAALAYARCMRSHGVPDFPDPDSDGNFNLGINQQGGGSRGSGSGSGSGQESSSSHAISSQERAADQVCHHLLAAGPQMNAAQQQHALTQLLKYAQCMRAHGVPNFPDPHTTSGGIGVPSGIGFDLAGINLHAKSPQYQAANHACQSLASHAKG